MKIKQEIVAILALAHLAAPVVGQDALPVQLDGFAGDERELNSVEIIRENLQRNKWRPEPKREDPFEPLLRLPTTTLPETETRPSSLPRVTNGQLVPLLRSNDIYSQIVDGSEAPKLINALVPDADLLENRLREISLSSTERSAQCDQASQAVANDNDLRSYLNTLPLAGEIPVRFAPQIAAFSSACFRRVFAPSGATEPGFIADLRSRAGLLRILRRPGVVSYCSALLVDGRTAVTARHCFYNPSSARFPNESMSFIRLASNAYEEVPVRISTRFDPDPDETIRKLTVADDFVTIDLGREYETLSTVPLNADPDVFAFDAMFQVGFYNIFFLSENSQESLIERLRKAYVIDESRSCAPITYSETCIVQLCQSMPQTSGAAFVGVRSNRLEILGTLFGAENRSADCFPPELPLDVAAKTNLSSRSR
jgi:hypothetical protein